MKAVVISSSAYVSNKTREALKNWGYDWLHFITYDERKREASLEKLVKEVLDKLSEDKKTHVVFLTGNFGCIATVSYSVGTVFPGCEIPHIFRKDYTYNDWIMY